MRLTCVSHLLAAHVTDSSGFNRDFATSFDSSQHLLSSWVRFGTNLLFFLFLSFFLKLCANHAKIISAFQFLFSFDIVILLLIAIVLFTLIIANWILFLIESLVV
jgi:hypothetical protein